MTEETKTNGITMLIASNHIHVNADITFTVAERGGQEAIHIADAVGQLILENLRQQEAARLLPGSYKASMTLISSAVEAPPEEEEKPKKKAPAKKKATKKATKKRAVRKPKNS